MMIYIDYIDYNGNEMITVLIYSTFADLSPNPNRNVPKTN